MCVIGGGGASIHMARHRWWWGVNTYGVIGGGWDVNTCGVIGGGGASIHMAS